MGRAASPDVRFTRRQIRFRSSPEELASKGARGLRHAAKTTIEPFFG
jgi:hypothetical protein